MGRRKETHIRSATLEALHEGRRAPEELALQALEHLVGKGSACRTCSEVLRPYPLERIAEKAGQTYRERVGRALRRGAAVGESLRRERQEADELLVELARERDLGRAQALLLESPRFATLGLAMALIDQVVGLVDEKPSAARGLAVMAACVAGRLSPRRYPPTVLADLRCGVYAALADALQATGDLDEAERAVTQADDHRREGSGQELYGAELDLVRCRILIARGRPREARERCVAVRRWALGAGVRDYAERAILVGARAARAAGELTRAALELKALAGTMRGEGDWSREHRVRLELVTTLCEAGAFREACSELDSLRLLSDGSETPVGKARLGLWSGVALRGVERPAEAEDDLRSAWHALAANGLPVEALRAALELLVLYATQGRQVELEVLSDELPDLLMEEALPEWGAGILLAVLREIWMGELHAIEEARLLVDQILAVGAKGQPTAPRH